MKENIVLAGKKILAEKLVSRSWGNISGRTDPHHFLITPSGCRYDTLSEDELVSVEIETMKYDASLKPSSEIEMHQKIYAYIKEANFIIHTHQKYATAVSVINDEEGRRAFNIADYALAGTAQLAESVIQRAISSEKQYVIMANHGIIAWGKDCQEVFEILNEVEQLCKDYVESLPQMEQKDEDIAYLDDYAQYFGEEKAKMSNCDISVYEEILSKNRLAQRVAESCGSKPLDIEIVRFMRNKYVNQYSKLYK